MIFSGPLYGKVLRGEKTQTRRLTGDFRPGMRLCVKKSQREPFGAHIILSSARRESLGAISFEDARAEGFKTTDDFKIGWVQQHDKSWLEDAPLEVFGCILARFAQRWSTKFVWVLDFTLDHSEKPRLLADRNAKADYVESPARALSGTADAGEAIDAKTQERFSREGFQGWVAREGARELAREKMSASSRLRMVRFEAAVQGVDIADLEVSVLSRIRQMERKVNRKKEAA